jgi:hypothetical protein
MNTQPRHAREVIEPLGGQPCGDCGRMRRCNPDNDLCFDCERIVAERKSHR